MVTSPNPTFVIKAESEDGEGAESKKKNWPAGMASQWGDFSLELESSVDGGKKLTN